MLYKYFKQILGILNSIYYPFVIFEVEASEICSFYRVYRETPELKLRMPRKTSGYVTSLYKAKCIERSL